MGVFSGIGFMSGDSPLSSSDADVQAYFDAIIAADATLNSQEVDAIENLVSTMKTTSGLTGAGWMWRNSTYVYPMLGTNIEARTINLMDASNTNSYLQLNGNWSLSEHGLNNNGVGWADITTTGSLFQYGGIWAVTSQTSGNGKILYGNYVSGSTSNNEMVLNGYNSSYWGQFPGTPSLSNAAYFQTNALLTNGSAPQFLPQPTNRDRFGYQYLGASINYANTFQINLKSGVQSGFTSRNTIPGTRGVKATFGGAYDSSTNSVANIADVDVSYLHWTNDLTTTLGATTQAQVRAANASIMTACDNNILVPLNKISVNYSRL